MKAEIITIGDEILIGQIVDTNSAWLAGQFNLNGIEVCRITSVHDNLDHIQDALKKAAKKVDFVLMTGGLGPTKDDITKQTLCNFFQTELVFHEPTFKHIKERFLKRNIDLNKLNRDQALVPETCTVLPNKSGTAPGMWFEKDGVIYVSVPGVPFEMKNLVENEVLPRLRETGKTKSIYHRTVLTQGIPESMLAEKLEDWENKLPGFVKLAYLPNPMAVRLRLSAMGKDYKILAEAVEKQVESLHTIIPEYIFGYDKETMAEIVGRLLRERGKTLAVAESCTGGFISQQITLVPGSSDYFLGSVTAYSNDIKKNILGVNEGTLLQHGAVSSQAAKEMATGALKALKADVAIATTGIAGPGGGTAEKPVGTVWIAIANAEKVVASKYVFGNNRERNIIRSGQTALQLLRRFILEEM